MAYVLATLYGNLYVVHVAIVTFYSPMGYMIVQSPPSNTKQC